MKIRPLEAELFHADRETDRRTAMTKQIITFPNFANVPKMLEINSNILQQV
jgi:hypothetical protein